MSMALRNLFCNFIFQSAGGGEGGSSLPGGGPKSLHSQLDQADNLYSLNLVMYTCTQSAGSGRPLVLSQPSGVHLCTVSWIR